MGEMDIPDITWCCNCKKDVPIKIVSYRKNPDGFAEALGHCFNCKKKVIKLTKIPERLPKY